MEEKGILPLEKLASLAKEKRSRLILALDLVATGERNHIRSKVSRLLKDLKELVIGIKIGYPFLLSAGSSMIEEIINDYRHSYFFIADIKLADVPHIARIVSSIIAHMGFDALITHIFQMGLEDWLPDAMALGIGIIGVLMMSHKGAKLFESLFQRMLKYVEAVNLDGVVIGATRPGYIREARRVLGDQVAIFSPGIIRQGAEPGIALKSGADYEIVGRAIIESLNPLSVARYIVKKEREIIYGSS